MTIHTLIGECNPQARLNRKVREVRESIPRCHPCPPRLLYCIFQMPDAVCAQEMLNEEKMRESRLQKSSGGENGTEEDNRLV